MRRWAGRIADLRAPRRRSRLPRRCLVLRLQSGCPRARSARGADKRPPTSRAAGATTATQRSGTHSAFGRIPEPRSENLRASGLLSRPGGRPTGGSSKCLAPARGQYAHSRKGGTVIAREGRCGTQGPCTRSMQACKRGRSVSSIARRGSSILQLVDFYPSPVENLDNMVRSAVGAHQGVEISV